MSRYLSSSAIIALCLGGTAALADVPQVAVDIAPVHSLVMRVMDGVGEPKLIVPAGASPHEYNLRPSEAKALQEADLVFMVGANLTPWLDKAVETLAVNANVTEFMHAKETQVLELREDVLFEAHVHGEDADHDEDHDDEDHDDKDHDGHEDEGHDEHGDGAHDPHVWLSPDNAKEWLNLVAARLSASDPDNASAYFSNAAAAHAELDNTIAQVNDILEPVRGMNFIVFHDAYQYFEAGFDFPAVGAISLSDASQPSPARITEIQTRIREEGIDCVLTEPQFNAGIVVTVLDGTDAGTAVLDPLGSSLEPGKSLYPTLLKSLASALADCH